jgi:hypothetical protein
MTSLAHNRTNVLLALAIPAAGFFFLAASSSQTMNAVTVGVTLGLGALWLAAVVALNGGPDEPACRIAAGGRNGDDNPMPRPAVPPPYGVNVSRPLKPWRWTSVLLAPVELLALAWSIPVIILLIMVPIGLALAGALWLARLIVERF